MFSNNESIAPYLPREGPETEFLCKEAPPFFVYSTLSTSRGAGNLEHIPQNDLNRLYSYLSTSRGAGNSSTTATSSLSCLYSSLSTSGGVGNLVLWMSVPFHPMYIAPYLPREGAKTQLRCFQQLLLLLLRIRTYLPREGAETIPMVSLQS